MFGIVDLEIIIGIGHKTFQFARKQEVGEDVTGIVGEFFVGTIADGDREMLHRLRCLELQTDGLEGLVFVLQAADSNRIQVVVVVIDEEQAIGQQPSVFIENDEIVDTCRQQRGIERDTSAVGNGLEGFQHPATEYCHRKAMTGGEALWSNLGGKRSSIEL